MPDLPAPTVAPGHVFFFGLGYTALRLARRMCDAGWSVSGTVRSAEKAAAVSQAEGMTVHAFDGTAPIAAADPFAGVTHLVDTVPPREILVPALDRHGTDLRACETLRWIGYLSTPAVYGDRQGGVVTEDEPPTPGSRRGELRSAAERAWLDAFADSDVAVQVFRVAGIYGPGEGRNAIEQLKAGKARIIDKPGQVFNRIHVDDIGSILLASMARPRDGGIYNVADTEACSPADPIVFAAGLLGIDPPPAIPFDSAELSEMARSFYSECKRLDTSRLTGELGVRLTYPTYREGLRAIAREAGVSS
ncbi:SDR family oxidoreductase [Thalassobaculum litoreum]|uniref:Nucleoside-diphosphate-sugar epimerase n=1 Tax=Thalassobaculum litoreum DSM 18839 TaxID=1123362 RepID=A0A8G2EVJ4_9PROT|nr:SDR family oxidoreductase [Thalassobaculum litoreum]SDF30065.1 Nucleoside-diphosphate-sugar epimerase [Thalassobaculum litoreum DSM 18839]